MGWVELASSASTICQSNVGSILVKTSTTLIRPSVRVPVLSMIIMSIFWLDSIACGPRINIPSCAPRPVPTSSAVGVASPSAHGQAITSTAIPVVIANPGSFEIANQVAAVTNASPTTIGTKISETRSTSRVTSALPVWA